MSERFFASTLITGDRALLEGTEAHHLTHVMRAKVGDSVVLFDGSGREFDAQVEKVGKSQVELTLLTVREVDRESPLRLKLAIALPKGDRQQWLVEKAVEMGVTAIVPLIAERSVAQPVASALARLRRAVIEASKQCGRNRLMEIAEPQKWTTFAALPNPAGKQFLAHPGGRPLHEIWHGNIDALLSAGVTAAIGPEGGFTDEEVQQGIAAGWALIDLGPRILRVESAAIAIAAWASLSSK